MGGSLKVEYHGTLYAELVKARCSMMTLECSFPIGTKGDDHV